MKTIKALVLASLLFWASASSYAQITRSVVRVETIRQGAPRAQASGFVYGSSGFVVTSAHVALRANRINVTYHSGDVIEARAVKWDIAHDLALLRVASAPASAVPIERAVSAPGRQDVLTVLGFPLGVPRVSSHRMVVREIGGSLLREIVNEEIRDELRNKGFGTLLDCPVLDLEGTLLPGHSGAPVLNAADELVGIGDGGMENGAATRSWAISAVALDSLMSKPDVSSPPQNSPGVAVVRSLFGAEMNGSFATDERREVALSNTNNNVRLIMARTRSFTDVQRTCDDQIGLTQLLQELANTNIMRQARGQPVIEPSSFSYDIYQDIGSGASFAVPAGTRLSEFGDFFACSLPGGRLLLRLQCQRANSAGLASHLTNVFLGSATRDLPIQWVPDARVSQAPVLSNLGFLFRRTSWYGNEATAFGPQLKSYAFMVTAVREATMLGAIVINRGWLAGDFDTQMWVQLHMGIQLTTFSADAGGSS